MSIDGTSGNDPLNGTSGPDVINGLAGNDTISGGEGNDTINGGDGNDVLSGEGGDDLFIEDTVTSGADVFNGGAGIDTIELRAVLNPVPSQVGLVSPHAMAGPSQLVSIERLVFTSQASDIVQGVINFNAATALTQVVGSTGRDQLIIIAGGNGTFTMPSLNLSGFTAPALNAWENTGDSVILVSAPPTNGTATLNAATGFNALQVLIAQGGTITLNGSANGDVLVAGSGINQLNGNGGNDVLSVSNAVGGTNTFAGATLDGGAGTDLLGVGGVVHFLGQLSNIEGVNLSPAFNSPNPAAAPSIPAAVLEVDSQRLAMLPASAFFRGTGTVQVDVSNGTGFDGSQYTFQPGADVTFHVIGQDGNGLNYVGTSGDDIIDFGAGNQTANGGAGADIFRPGGGNNTIVGFTPGVDKLDLSHFGLSDPDLLGLFASDVNGSATLAITFGGVVNTLTLQGVSRSALTDADVILADPLAPVNNTGTDQADTLFGSNVGDVLNGLGSNDLIFTGGGVDFIDAGAGDDTVVLTGPILPGNNTSASISGGLGNDTLLLTAKAVLPNANVPNTNLVLLVLGSISGFETISFDASAYGAQPLPLTAVAGTFQFAPGSTTTLRGSAANDVMVVVPLQSDASHSLGNVFNMPSFNLVNWSDSDAVVLSGGNIVNNLTLGTANHAGRYFLGGGSGNDNLNGSDGIETLTGNDGNDTLNGGAGNDALDGSAGRDVAVYAATRANATVTHDALTHVWTVASAADGTDTVKNVEQYQFADGLYSFQFATATNVLANFGGQQGWTSQATNQRLLADVNGDGKADIVGFGFSAVRVALGNGDGTFQAAKVGISNYGPAQDWDTQDHYPRLLADVNGDGRADIVAFGYAGTFVSFGQADGTFGAKQLGIANFGGQLGWNSQNVNLRLVADVNGDGKADILGFGFSAVRVALGNGDGTFQAAKIGIADFGPSLGWANQDQYSRQLADVNGDGKLDLVGFGGAAVFTALGNGDGTFQASHIALADMSTALGWTSQSAFPRVMADVNGDGRADIVGFGYGGASVALARADGTFNAASLAVAGFGTAQGWTSQDATPRQLADLNHDGKLDILGFGPDGTAIAYGNGDGTFSAVSKDLANFGNAQGWTSNDNNLHQIADLNGDGLPDVLGFAFAGVKVAMNQGDVVL